MLVELNKGTPPPPLPPAPLSIFLSYTHFSICMTSPHPHPPPPPNPPHTHLPLLIRSIHQNVSLGLWMPALLRRLVSAVWKWQGIVQHFFGLGWRWVWSSIFISAKPWHLTELWMSNSSLWGVARQWGAAVCSVQCFLFTKKTLLSYWDLWSEIYWLIKYECHTPAAVELHLSLGN